MCKATLFIRHKHVYYYCYYYYYRYYSYYYYYYLFHFRFLFLFLNKHQHQHVIFFFFVITCLNSLSKSACERSLLCAIAVETTADGSDGVCEGPLPPAPPRCACC
jgi:hypothetical protein